MSTILPLENEELHPIEPIPHTGGINRPSKRRRKSLEETMYSEEDFHASEAASGPSSSQGESPLGPYDFVTEEDSAPIDRPWTAPDTVERAWLKGLPPLAPWEGEYVCHDILSKMRAPNGKAAVETSPWFNVPRDGLPSCSRATFRLLVHPAGNDSAKGPGPAAYVEFGQPEAESDEPPAPQWWYMDTQYYVCILNFVDWKSSIVHRDQFAFSFDQTDRGWHTLTDQNKEPISRFIGREGQMIFRFGVLPRGIRLCDRGVRQRGLKNLGMTCYLNSLLQCLFHVPAFRAAIFQMTADTDEKLAKEIRDLDATDKVAEPAATPYDPHQSCKLSDRPCPNALNASPPTQLLKDLTEADIEDAYSDNGLPKDYRIGNLTVDLSDSSTTARALQKVFLQLNRPMSESVDVRSNLRIAAEEESVNCQDLIRSFNWDVQDQFMQHDAQELNRLLCDKLETEMKGTKTDGFIRTLFGGESEMFIECINVDYKSKRKEVYYDLQLDVRGLPNIEASLQRYIEAETLDGDNAYFADHFGRQAARKGVRFISCPPVLQFHLKRFTYDLEQMDMVKVNDEFKFPETLDMEPFCPGAGKYNLLGVNVHQGDVHSGHYYAFIRTRSPDGKRVWLRFDDERVCRVDRYAAVDMNFGGHAEEIQCPYTSKTSTRPIRSQLIHSAYILFYIKAAKEEELLTCPSPQTLNPGLEIRLKLQESVYARRNATRSLIEKNIQLSYVVDRDIILKHAKGIWRHPSELPARQVQQRPVRMEAMEVWEETSRDVEAGLFGEDVRAELMGEDRRKSLGLFYFDYHPRKVQPPEFAQANGFSPLYCREDELKLGMCLWSVELIYTSNNAGTLQTSGRQTVGRNHGYIDNELKAPQRILNLTILLASFDTHLDEAGILQAHEKAQLCPIKVYDPWAADVFYFGTVNFAQEKAGNDATREIGKRLALTWRNEEYRNALTRQGLSQPMASLLDHTLRGEGTLLPISAHWEERGCFETAPTSKLGDTSNAPYRCLCVSFNLRELECNEKLRACLPAGPLSACTGVELREFLNTLKAPDQSKDEPRLVHFGEAAPLQVISDSVKSLQAKLELTKRKFCESPATLLCSLRDTRSVKFDLYDYTALMSRSETITGRRIDSRSDGVVRSTSHPLVAEASETVVVQLTWPAETLLRVAAVLMGVRQEYLVMLDFPPTLFSAPTIEPYRRGSSLESLAEESRTKEPLTLGKLRSRLVSDVLSQYIQRQDAFGYVRPSEKFFASDHDIINCPVIPILRLPRPASTIWSKPTDTATLFVKVFHKAVLGALTLDLKIATNPTIKEVIERCVALIGSDDRMVARLEVGFEVWKKQAVDLIAYTPHSMLRFPFDDLMDQHLPLLIGLRTPQLRVELRPMAGEVEEIIMDCFNLDSNNCFFGHPFSVALRKTDTLATVIPRMPNEAHNAVFYTCPTRSILDHMRTRRPLQPQSVLWPSAEGIKQTGDGEKTISPHCLIVEHTLSLGGTGRSEGKTRRQTALNLR